MTRVWTDGYGGLPLSAANLNAMEADIASALGVPDSALAARINDTTPQRVAVGSTPGRGLTTSERFRRIREERVAAREAQGSGMDRVGVPRMPGQ